MSGQSRQSNQNTQANGKISIITASISGICVILSSIIGIFSYNLNESNKTLTVENVILTAQNNDWETSYNELQKQFNELDSKNTSLSSELNNLKNNIIQYIDENDSLNNQIESLQNKINMLENSNQKQSEEIIINPSSYDDINKFEGLIWDILPDERWNSPDIRLPRDGDYFIMSGEKKYGAYISTSYDKTNVYLYLNHEFSDVSFKIGHIDQTYERDIKISIYLDDIIYEEPYIITYSEQPKEFKLSNLSKVGTVRIEFDSSKDGGGSGPSYGISDIYLKHTSTH